jgi:SPRY domain
MITRGTTGIADDDFENEDDTFKRKRRWTPTTAAHVSTASTATSSTTTTATTSPLLQLPMELQCLIYQYGTLTELRHLTMTCTTLRQSLLAPNNSDYHDDDGDDPHATDQNDSNDSNNDIVESALWQPFCIHQYWPFLQSSRPFIRSITHSHSSNNTYYSDHQIKPFHYPVILSMAVPKVPTHIDATLFPPARSLWVFDENDVRQRRTIRPKIISMNCTILTTINNTISCRAVETNSPQQQHQVIQFVGPVGLGDQCIRCNAPLPRPKRIRITKTPLWNLPYRPDPSTLFQRVFRNTSDGRIGSAAAVSTVATMMRSSSTGTTSSTSLFCPLRRSARINARRGSPFSSSHATTASSSTLVSRTIVPYRPFCVPFLTLTNEINIAPRYIAYYEVTILPLPHQAEQNDSQTTATIIHRRYTKETTTTITKMIQYPQPQPTANPMPTNRSHNNNVISDCVAVGIGTESFPLQHRMPGWDQNSYGYHGDDGGIFHGNGSMIQQYNRTFGVNDTIGCGIDYIQNSIFFTLNGVFLGYAFPLLPKHRDIDLYPIIGMDTQYPILCNFGCHEPFVFDLQSMTQQHATIIQQQIL